MNRHDGPSLPGHNCFLHSSGIEQERVGLDIHEDQPKTAVERGPRGGDKGQVRNDDLAAVIQPVVIQHRSQSDPKGIGAVSATLLRTNCFRCAELTLDRFTKDEMQRELLENMYRTDTLDELLKESDYTIRRRKECQQMVESLTRANEIVSQVQ